MELQFGDKLLYSAADGWNPEVMLLLIGSFAVAMLIGLAVAVGYVILVGIVDTVYAKFNLDIVNILPEPKVGTLFSYFTYWKTITGASLLRTLYVFLWSLLFVIPGIIASYDYAMVRYIHAENPLIPAREVLAQSKEMMRGNRMRLFCLQISFIGWAFLCVLTCGIGYLWLLPYQEAANAAFYRDISNPRPLFEEPMLKPEFQ